MAKAFPEFYLGDTVDIARRLLGTYLVRQLGKTVLVGRITETEAYIGRCDKACHAYGYHKTPRNAPMFLGPGHAYIYLIYGMHHCLNLVTEPEGEPAAVLIRALEPIAGEETIRRLRYGDQAHDSLPHRPSAGWARQGLPGAGADHGGKRHGPDRPGRSSYAQLRRTWDWPIPRRSGRSSSPVPGSAWITPKRPGTFPGAFSLKRRTAEGCFSLIWTEP